MDEFEKVEKLRLRANVSYEEAKEALDASGNDLLDAMIYLEKHGKIQSEKTVYSTSYSASEESSYDKDTASDYSSKSKGCCSDDSDCNGFFKNLLYKSKVNFFVIERKSETILKIPVWGFVIALLLIEVSLPLLIVGLFLDCRYSFTGEDDLSQVNDVMGKCSTAVHSVKDEFANNKGDKSDNK